MCNCWKASRDPYNIFLFSHLILTSLSSVILVEYNGRREDGKTLALIDCGGLWGCDMLYPEHFLNSRLTDGGDVSTMHWPPSTPKEIYLEVSGSIPGATSFSENHERWSIHPREDGQLG
jgi:hypothetical protein